MNAINKKRAFYKTMGTLDSIMTDIIIYKRRPATDVLNMVGMFFTEPYEEARYAFKLFRTIVENQEVELDNVTSTALNFHVNHIIELTEKVYYNDQ